MSEGEVGISRPAKVVGVMVASSSGPTPWQEIAEHPPELGLPQVAITVCLPDLDGPDGKTYHHEHVVIGLDSDTLDTLETARRALAELVTDGGLT